jgi:hypothetical protein
VLHVHIVVLVEDFEFVQGQLGCLKYHLLELVQESHHMFRTVQSAGRISGELISGERVSNISYNKQECSCVLI